MLAGHRLPKCGPAKAQKTERSKGSGEKWKKLLAERLRYISLHVLRCVCVVRQLRKKIRKRRKRKRLKRKSPRHPRRREGAQLNKKPWTTSTAKPSTIWFFWCSRRPNIQVLPVATQAVRRFGLFSVWFFFPNRRFHEVRSVHDWVKYPCLRRRECCNVSSEPQKAHVDDLTNVPLHPFQRVHLTSSG